MFQPQPRSPELACMHSSHRSSGGWVVGLIAKRSYEVVQGTCRVSPDQTPLVMLPELDERGQILRDSEYMLQKQSTDLSIAGHARSAHPLPQFQVEVRLGAQTLQYLISGPRKAYRTQAGSVAFTAPEPICEVPMDWALAYGGVDRASLAAHGDPALEFAKEMGSVLADTQSIYAYPRNPLGKGYCFGLDPRAEQALDLPQIEFDSQRLTPDNLVLHDPGLWPRAVMPASTRALPYTFFPRSNQLGFAPRDYRSDQITARDFAESETMGIKPIALSPEASILDCICSRGVSQSSAPGLRFDSVKPGTPICIVNMHPHHARWTFNLPAQHPRMGFRFPNATLMQPRPMISSVRIEPDTSTVEIVWVAATHVEHPYTPIQLQKAQYGIEWCDA